MSSQRTSIFWWAAAAALMTGIISAADGRSEQGQDELSPAETPGEPSETLTPRKARPAAVSATIEPKTTPARMLVTTSTPPGLQYLALGDSYTMGEKVADGERFPAQLTKRLRARGLEVRSPQLVARTGWTTADLSAGIAAANPQGTFDLVTLLIGVNNQYRGLDVAAYRLEFAGLVERAAEFAGGEPGRVVVISIPDWGATPYARNFDRVLIAQQIDGFNQANKSVASEKGVRYVNVTTLTRKSGDDASLVAADRLHPSGKQYQLWVDLILPEALGALGQ
jgi:lysophospholipase L1-like esterase